MEDPRLPETWDAKTNVLWKTPIPGRGWSSPAAWGDRVFVTTAITEGTVEEAKKGLYIGGNRPATTDVHRWVVYCLDVKTGAILWEKEAARSVPAGARHLKNSYASETPVCDGERVYAYFGNIGLFAYDRDGRLAWEKKWKAYPIRFGWGTASSPVLHEDRIYVVNDNDEHSFLAALDKKTGNQIWQVDREEKSNWTSPFVWVNDRRTEIVTAGTGGVRSYGLDGVELWGLKGMSRIDIPTPFAQDGLLYVASGYVGDTLRPVYAIRPGASGDVSLRDGETSNTYVAWSLRQGGPYNPSPLVYRGLYYTLLDRGFLTCHDAKTGAEVYSRRQIAPGANAFTSSPWASNGKIYCLSEDGDTFVIQAGREFKLLGKNSLDEMCMATPAFVDGRLLIRTESNLYCIAKSAQAPAER